MSNVTKSDAKKRAAEKTERVLKMRETQYGSQNIKPFELATAHTPTWRKAPAYKTGDEDHNVYIPREGSCHKHLKSFGVLT